MSNSTILATISDKAGNNVRDVSIQDYEKMLAGKEKKEIAEMIYHRFYGRYLKPFLFDSKRYRKHYKHGFSMMASACLLIETLKSFENGWEETPRDKYGDQVFDSFFKRELAFKELAKKKFYKNVRCGLLHQGETTGKFTIERGEPTEPIFNSRDTSINANRFFVEMERSLVAYTERLVTEEWDSTIWDKFRQKMCFIISHC
jgi:hypothetical protein